MKVLPLRLHPGDDLRQALETWMGEQQEQAGCVISAIGSLSVAELVVGLLPEWRFSRELDPATGYAELRISPRSLG
jgi:predicted DNA-binding protein with PD1-like motif